MKKITAFIASSAMLLLHVSSGYAQGVAVNTTGAAADVSAMLDVNSGNKGVLVPRMDSMHRTGISAPALGLLVYQTDGTPGFYYYNGSAWTALGAPVNATLQGNTFNLANKLVQLDGTGKLPTVDGSQLTNLPVTAVDAGTLTGSTLASGVNASSLTSVGTLASLTVTTPITGSITGNAATATKLQTARNINGVPFDGTADITISSGSGGGSAFNDTLIQNLYTNGYLLSADGTTGILLKDNGQFVDKGDYGSGSALAESGAGVKMFWYPRQAAFRAGGVSGTTWDDANIGPYSTAFGSSTKANGAYATAMGGNTIASGPYATAIGFGTTASGYYATAIGNATTASGDESVAMGYNTTANSSFSTAMGGYTTAGNQYATAMGYYTTASGVEAVSMGYNTTASGAYATAMGYNTVAGGTASVAMGNAVSTGTYSGCLVAGDYSTATVLSSSTYNQMTMRFAGGYRLYSNSSSSAGVTLAFGGSSWASVSDRRKKENFTTLDKEDMLMKVCAMPVTRWNYKSQPTAQKHVGPMAQDFYAAFGLDGVGCDTTINTVDIDGVNMIAIQALEKRTEELQKENDALKAQLAKQHTDFAARMDKVEAMLAKKEEEQKLSVK